MDEQHEVIASTSHTVGGNSVKTAQRPRPMGKFLFVGDEKLFVRGVTYGPFRPDPDGSEYHQPVDVDRDFALMAANGINAVRTYTVPPRWLLDCALRHGLRVMVGLPWEQHITFLDSRARVRAIEQRVRDGVRAVAGHPSLLGYAIGNEIPAPIVRWYGAGRIERFLRRLYDLAKSEDPDGLVTYVNYPTTEYLRLPFLDFVCFNVYLEARDTLDAYLARLQNLADDRPLVMAEIGLDSRRNGDDTQAHVLDWQVRSAFDGGCAGLFVFAWTDEWHRGGHDIEDWDFGLTTRDRVPKPALASVREAFGQSPFHAGQPWPRISVVVCSHNGARTLRDCLEGLTRLCYPDFEVIVVDDGSTDGTSDIARAYPFRVISTASQGLSAARNTGLEAATGEILAYIDDDAYPDRHWLAYLARAFVTTDYAAIGGPNIAPPGDGVVAECVASAPGGPVHVLVSDTEAEHIPGCNMAFRAAALREVGGFDPAFVTAGDDVDVCWRLMQQGLRIGFSPSALVWHHRRNSVQAYWRQQVGYGKAEALLEMKWPQKYSSLGHPTWRGRLYGRGIPHRPLFGRWRVYAGVWGSLPFQALYQRDSGVLSALVLMPDWYLAIVSMALFVLMSAAWPPLVWFVPILIAAVGASFAQAAHIAWQKPFHVGARDASGRLKRRALTAALHLLQPLARLVGRVRYGLTPWRLRGSHTLALPIPRTLWFWSERWRAPEQRLEEVEAGLRQHGAVVARGGDFDRWDLEVRAGLFGDVRVRLVTEEHGAGHQRTGFRIWPRWSSLSVTLAVVSGALAIVAGVGSAWLAAGLFAALTSAVFVASLGHTATSTSSLLLVLNQFPGRMRRAEPARRPAGRSG